MNEQELFKLIKSKEQSIKEKVLITTKLEELKKEIEFFLDKNLREDENNLLYLHYKKFKSPGSKPRTLWSTTDGYPMGGEEWIQPWIDFFNKYLGEKTIKRRLKTEEYWLESRLDGEDEHILIGKRNENGKKAHIIIDGESAEIRVEDKSKSSEELIKHIETRLTLHNGKKVRSTREAVEFFEDENEDEIWSDINLSIHRIMFKGYPVLEIYNSGKEDVENFKLILSWEQKIEGPQSRVQNSYFQTEDDPMWASPSTMSLLVKGERKYANNIPTSDTISKMKAMVECNGVQSGKPYKKEFDI
jgi:hypothetical protein